MKRFFPFSPCTERGTPQRRATGARAGTGATNAGTDGAVAGAGSAFRGRRGFRFIFGISTYIVGPAVVHTPLTPVSVISMFLNFARGHFRFNCFARKRMLGISFWIVARSLIGCKPL